MTIQRRKKVHPLEKIEGGSYDHREHDHRMQPCQTSFEKLPRVHFAPTVIICVTCDETAEDKEEVHSQVTVVDRLGGVTRSVSLHQMVADHHQSRHANVALP